MQTTCSLCVLPGTSITKQQCECIYCFLDSSSLDRISYGRSDQKLIRVICNTSVKLLLWHFHKLLQTLSNLVWLILSIITYVFICRITLNYLSFYDLIITIPLSAQYYRFSIQIDSANVMHLFPNFSHISRHLFPTQTIKDPRLCMWLVCFSSYLLLLSLSLRTQSYAINNTRFWMQYILESQLFSQFWSSTVTISQSWGLLLINSVLPLCIQVQHSLADLSSHFCCPYLDCFCSFLY